MDKLRKVIVISGMTGVGKTSIAKILAQHLNGEIISADSLQIYKGLNILTNKPVVGTSLLNQRSLLSNPAALNNGGLGQTHHLMNQYDPLDPISSTIYAHQARAVIKDILSRNKIPVIEGGSPFYIHQIFNPNLSNYNDETFFEARKIARHIIKLDGYDFNKTFKRMFDICQKVHVPESENKIGQNDFYRLENKMAFALYLQAKGLTYQKFIETASQTEDNILFKNLNRRNFYLFGNKQLINQVLDLRVEDMVLNEGFFKEIMEYSQQLIKKNDPHHLKINPLMRSIGFTETLSYLQQFHQYDSNIYFDYKRRNNVRKEYKRIVQNYLEDFKVKNRQYAKRQNIWYRKEKDFLWVDVMSEGKLHNVVNKLIDHIRQEDIRKELDSDSQEKMRTVNTDQEQIKQLKQYKSEGRILADPNLFNDFLINSLKTAKVYKDEVMNPLLIDKEEVKAEEDLNKSQNESSSNGNASSTSSHLYELGMI